MLTQQVRPGTQSSSNFKKGVMQSSEMYQPSIGQSSGTNILTQTTHGEASPHTPININESHTKPLADMERLRKERLGNKVGPNSKKFRQLRAILDSKIEKSQKSK